MQRLRILAAAVAVLTIAACGRTGTPTAEPEPALFYAKGGEIYISAPPGSPGRRLTTGPGDTQPAPSPDGRQVAYVHRATDDEPGGELRVLDIASGNSRQLVDPADVVPRYGDEPGNVEMPRWSPTGDRIAFLKATFAGGGFLLTADAKTGAVSAPGKPLFADEKYGWSPDGQRIAWTGGRSDVSPVTVNVLTVGGENTELARDTNALSVSYAGDGTSVLFTNGDATGKDFAAIPFALREGGIYAVSPSTGPQSKPRPLYTGTGFYSDVTALPSGAVAFTEANDNSDTRTIRVLDRDSRAPRTVAEATAAATGPRWSGDTVAYIGTADNQPLLIKQGDGDARQVDTGVETFAWAG